MNISPNGAEWASRWGPGLTFSFPSSSCFFFVFIFSGSMIALLASLFALASWVPRFFVVRARAYWTRVGLMFRLMGLKGLPTRQKFHIYWMGHQISKQGPPLQSTSIVFGPTHIVNRIDSPAPEASEKYLSILRKGTRWWPEALFNISSWVREVKEGRWELFFPTIFYADDEGALILGWDADKGERGEPFLIPRNTPPSS